MNFTFDLISDLHLDTWNESFDWEGQATSPFCVVAGDIARDPRRVIDALKQLSKCYQGTFYIDGNAEHYYQLSHIGDSYRELANEIDAIENVVFMQDNVVIVDGVAFLATNGWWTYDFGGDEQFDETIEWFKESYETDHHAAISINALAFQDATYLFNSVKKLQTHQDVNSIVIVTHTVPDPWLIEHDLQLTDTLKFNCMGNQHLTKCLEEDTENKIKAWCFGHYHGVVDRERDGIRYVNNCRGRGDTLRKLPAYFPKRITIN